MLRKWPIRVKLFVGLALLVLLVGILASGGLYTMYAYRDLAKSLSWRVTELPVAAELSRQVGDLRVTLSRLRGLRENPLFQATADPGPWRVLTLRDQFRAKLNEVEDTLDQYRLLLDQHDLAAPKHASAADLAMNDNQREREKVRQIETALERLRDANRDEDWVLDTVKIEPLDAQLEQLQDLAAALPSYLRANLQGYRAAVTQRYRTLIIGTWTTSLIAALLFALFVRLFWLWILSPLRVLIHGSRLVAGGRFDHRIHLQTDDEMAELARAMNDMTARFQDIRDDLDRQVQHRTKQVIRNEQLASVGFLAAGVAHEINNPLASIAMCAESLQGRIHDILDTQADESASDEQQAVISHYLQMIEDEAFRCKEITGKLLDFSRTGEVKRQNTALGQLVQDVVDMVGHLGKYQQKQVDFSSDEPVIADVNPQEIKQIVLNLLTNALDSIEDGGRVQIMLRSQHQVAELTISDNGCGMEPDVLEHIFEPFFTRRRTGQGTGLGLSITHRIITDHGGTIEADSPGAGQGSTFRVLLPLHEANKEIENQYQAA